jgi:hypothetical protein
MHPEFVPSVMNQLLTVEVYLPKNSSNSRELITLLCEVIEFRAAKKWMIENDELLYSLGVRIADLPPETGSVLGSNDMKRLAELLGERGFSIPMLDVRRENDKYWIQAKGTASCYLKDSEQGWGVYLPNTWNRTGEGSQRRVGAFPTSEEAYRSLQDSGWTLKEFGQYLTQMEKTILGYSIYEVEGAFESTRASRAVPIGQQYSIDAQAISEWRAGNEVQLREILLSLDLPSVGQIQELSAGNQVGDGIVVSVGDEACLLHAKAGGFEICSAIRMLEERTWVIRFLVDVGPGGGPSSQTPPNNTGKKLWDTIGLIGLFFVYNLGTRVGIEDEIWMTFDSAALLWAWKKGSVIRGSLDTKSLFS